MKFTQICLVLILVIKAVLLITTLSEPVVFSADLSSEKFPSPCEGFIPQDSKCP
jgi:hypothetical protein